MADMRSVSAAIEQYAIQHHHYPVADDYDELVAILEPDYIPTAPAGDGWQHAVEYVHNDGQGYLLRSPGKDGVFENTPPAGATRDFDCDIVFANGVFLQWPEGIQH